MAGGQVRPLTPRDAEQVRALFRATAAAGRPLQLPETDLVAYASLCLDYYLVEEGAACAVLVEDDALTGYAMVALDHAAFERWIRPRALRWVGRGLGRIARAPGSRSATFHRRRLLDGISTLGRGVRPPMPAHIHINVRAGRRGVQAGFALAEHADVVVRAAGLPGYFGEVNVPRRRPGREHALRRLGGVVVHRQPNHTMSWLAGQPVERLTIARSLDPADGWVALPAGAAGRSPQPPAQQP